MHTHPMPECNSLLPATERSDVIVHRGKCIGAASKTTTVPTTTLAPLLRQALAIVERIELLKIDIQGLEWPCLEGAGDRLRKGGQHLPGGARPAARSYPHDVRRQHDAAWADPYRRFRRAAWPPRLCATVLRGECGERARVQLPLHASWPAAALGDGAAAAAAATSRACGGAQHEHGSKVCVGKVGGAAAHSATPGELDARLPTNPNPCPSKSDPRCRLQ